MALKKLFPKTEADLESFTDTIEFLNPSQAHAEFTESFVVPASLVYQMPVPKKNTTITITVDAASRTIITTGTPSSGQVLVNRFTGKLTFHVSDDGGTAEVTTTPLYTPQSAEYLNWQQAQIAELVADAAASGDVDGPASATDGNLVLFDGTTGKLVRQFTGGDAVALRTALGLGTSSNVEFANGVFNGSGGVTATGERFRNTIDGANAGYIATSYGVGVPTNTFVRFSGSLAAPSALTNAQPFARFDFAAGYNATTAAVDARIDAIATENHSATNRGAKMVFQTVTNGTTVLVTRFETTDTGILLKNAITFGTATTPASVPNGSLFLNSSNSNALSFKDLSGTTQEIAFV